MPEGIGYAEPMPFHGNRKDQLKFAVSQNAGAHSIMEINQFKAELGK